MTGLIQQASAADSMKTIFSPGAASRRRSPHRRLPFLPLILTAALAVSSAQLTAATRTHNPASSGVADHSAVITADEKQYLGLLGIAEPCAALLGSLGLLLLLTRRNKQVSHA